MARFEVWAPRARKVEVAVAGRCHRLSATNHGWFAVDLPQAGPGADYVYHLDDQGPYPDPRSMWQPQGIFGPSRLIDHAQFRWSDHGWNARPLSSALIYELHIGTFTPEGTFDSAISRLDHLVDLGVTHVELLPVAEFPGTRGWGYDGVNLYAPHHAYGGPDGLKRLVDACHRRGLAVLLDVVYNHLGPSGNFLPKFGPYLIDTSSTLWGQAINFCDCHSDQVRRFFIDNALMWLRDYHLDGLRLDAVHAYVDTSAVHFLEELSEEVEALESHLGRSLVLIAESDLNDPRIVRSREAGGYGVDAQWSDDFHHCLHSLLTGERKGYYADFGWIHQLAKAFEEAFVYTREFCEGRGRRHGRAPVGLSGHRFLAYLQNHDQIGNRAAGDRIGHTLTIDQIKLGSALVMCAPFVPMLFQGEEWNASSPFQYFTDHQEAELARAVTQGRRKEFAAFGWKPEQVPDPQDAQTFERSKLQWDEVNRPPHREVLEWYRSLVRFRQRHSCLTDGRMDQIRTHCDEAARWLVIERGPLTIAANLSDQPRSVPIGASRGRQMLLASKPQIAAEQNHVFLPPQALAVMGKS